MFGAPVRRWRAGDEGTAPDRDGEERAPVPWWGWWGRITRAVLAAGALATAIAAILSLVPSSTPDPQDTARFTGVRVTPGVPLDEYQRRTAEMMPVAEGDDDGAAPIGPGRPLPSARAGTVAASTDGGGGTAVVEVVAHGRSAAVPRSAGQEPGEAPAVPTTAAPPATTNPPEPSTTAVPTTEATTTTSGGPTSSGLPVPAPEPALRFDVVTGDDDDGDGDGRTGLVFPFGEDRILEVIGSIDTAIAGEPSIAGCDDDPDGCELTVLESKALSPIVVANSVNDDGDPVPPEVAAERVVELLRATRVGDGDEPLGVVVATDVELEGLRGDTVFLTWSMWQQGGTTRLHGDWLDERLAYSLEPTTDHDTASLDLWIPLPPEPGPYFVRVALGSRESASALASADSEPFT